jgi:hypothetical protein
MLAWNAFCLVESHALPFISEPNFMEFPLLVESPKYLGGGGYLRALWLSSPWLDNRQAFHSKEDRNRDSQMSYSGWARLYGISNPRGFQQSPETAFT